MLIWLLLVWSLGWFALPAARRLWGDAPIALPDGGLAAGRALLLWGWTLLAFWLGHAGVPVRWSALLVYLLLALGALWAARDWRGIRATIRARRRGIVVSEAVFLVVFLLFFVLRGFWPDQSSWQNSGSGEKPMDMALLAACARAERLPPPNPYAAGERLDSYYYLGHLQAALLTDAIGSEPRHTYNLMCATLPALCFSMLASLCAALTGRLRSGMIAAALVLCSGTLEPLRQWLQAARRGEIRLWPLDYFATSRAIPGTINEYPWFTFSYGDLHAHFLAMPLALLVVSLSWALHSRVLHSRVLHSRVLPQRTSADDEVAAEATMKNEARALKPEIPRPVLFLLPVCGLALGALLAANTWDFPIYFLLTVLCLPGLRIGTRRASWILVSVAVLDVLIVAMAAASPFLSRLRSEARGPHLLEQPASPALAWLLVWGLLCIAWTGTLAVTAMRWLDDKNEQAKNEQSGSVSERVRNGASFASRNRVTLAVSCGLAALFVMLSLATRSEFFVLFLLAAMMVWTVSAAWRAQSAAHAFLCRLALCGLLALLWSETTWAGFLAPPHHRQDTVFKFGLQAWLLLGTAAACGAVSGFGLRRAAAGTSGDERQILTRVMRGILIALLPVALLASLATTVARARGFARFEGWDAWSHLAPAERRAATWLQRHARDGTHIIEAEKGKGSDYSEFARYTHATGIATVIGPAAHTFQWGLTWVEVARRKADVRAFYTSPAAAARVALLGKYAVRYVVCGELERRAYGAANVARIERTLPVVFRAGRGASRVAICAAPADDNASGRAR